MRATDGPVDGFLADPILDTVTTVDDTDGGRHIAYVEWGDPAGHPVVLLWGAPNSRLHCPAGATGEHVVTIDRPGYGGSTARPGASLLDTDGRTRRAAASRTRADQRWLVLVALILTVLMADPGSASAAPGGTPGPTHQPFNPAADTEENHCWVPWDGNWIDLNEVTGRSEAFAGSFCPDVDAGEFWIAGCSWLTNTRHDNYPDGYVPVAETPLDDFLAKLEAVKVVVDPDSSRESTYVFRNTAPLLNLKRWSELSGGTVPPEGDLFVLSYLPQLPPQPLGSHVAKVYLVMRAGHWDGLGLDEGLNYLPPGERLIATRRFQTVERASQSHDQG